MWLTNKETGGVFNTDWADKDRQIAENQAQGDSKNLEERYKNINPNFKKGASNLDSAGYNNNCVKCAIAFEANMRGDDVEANAFKFGELDEKDKSRSPEKAFDSKDIWDVGRPNRDEVVKEVEAMMQDDWGKGSRAIIQIDSGKIKHTMNVLNMNGKIVIVDSQEGKHGTVAQMLKGLPTKSVKLFRTDDKSINKEYSEWAYKKR